MAMFEENVKSVMQNKGLKQKYVAQKIGISEKAFSAMLTGRKNVLVTDVLNICNALEVSPNQLLGYDETA